MSAVLVTGGAGFIGSNLVRALLERGEQVRVLDNFSTGSRANLADLELEIVEGELRSYERVHNAVRGSEVVYHLGALGSVPRSVQDPLTSSAVNVEGTLNVLLAARDEGVRRVVFSSSTSVYGSSRRLPTSEDTPPDPISPYGVAKLAAERYCVSFSRVYESFETVVLRYFNVFGPRQSASSQYAAVVPIFVTRDRRGRADHDPRRRRAVARLHLRRQRRRSDDRGRPGARSERPRLQRRRRGAGEREPRRGHDRGDPRARGGEALHGVPAWRHPRFLGRPERGARRARLRARGVAGGGPAPHRGGDARRRPRLTSSSRPEPVRVLRLIARLNVGGPALHVAYLTRGLDARGYHTTLVAGSLGRGEGSMSFVAEELGITVVPIRELQREVSPLADLLTLIRLVRLIRTYRPEILHTHTAKAGTLGRLAALFSGRARPPVVVHTFHGHVLRGYFGPASTTFYRSLERALARFTTRLVAVSPEVRDELVSLGVAPPEKFSVIRLGLDLERRVPGGEGDDALRRELGIAPASFVVGWVGRMTAIKRVPDLLAAFAALRDRGVDARLCLVGDGPDRELLERRARELGVSEETLFVGYRRELGAYYELFDVLVLTSANEGTPVVAIEALAAGTPVVATDVGGVSDVVSDGVDGMLVAAGDVEAVASALERLAGDRVLARQMGEQGARHVRERYRVERLVEDVDALYRELLAQAGLPPPSA